MITDLKTRSYVVASGLGAYFGLYSGFGTTPLDQLQIDLGNEAAEFDDAAEARMDMGNFFEGPILDYFERILDIKITDRNTDYIYAFDDMLKGKIDGDTIFQGVPTGVECKMSNSASKNFVDNIGYHMQCQAYMKAKGYTQWLLLGLQNGKPMWKLLYRDDAMIADIEEMVTTVSGILNGMMDEESFPWHLVEKYGNPAPKAFVIEDLDDLALVDELLTLKAEVTEVETSLKEKEDRIAEIEAYLKETFTGTYVHWNGQVVTITETRRAGGYDVETLSIEHPELDLKKYQKPDSVFKRLTIKKQKKAKA